MKVLIVDYGAGNIGSVQNMLKYIGLTPIVSNDSKIVSNFDKIILPGVGLFSTAMKEIERLNLIDSLNEAVLVKKKSFLGICLGAQLINQFSEEGNSAGLSWLANNVVKFKQENHSLKIPHLGWNNIKIVENKTSPLLNGLNNNSRFYFVHSYHIDGNSEDTVLAYTEHGYFFPSIVNKENIFGVQFHPEKSHQYGLKLLENFLTI
ncbi:imidazole glycerol phosphate synthase subunit HisH [Emticicia sp. C21]|uniref:imidazole glycerol phosphate synthase subunit HisH n=1 Tax=Emticicia sp. C21 TaxID=2302915 RepID=UPI000E340923|nr:imidazole glycerol phosphate synthase subunit HisH [Emticicia sp. C21]RFS17239.1 imidazole glycerol phosphate synthase subunit HisH [Emticicia sp. C21]